MMHGIHTGRPGEVPQDFIQDCLVHDKLIAPSDHHTVACLLKILTDEAKGWFRVTRCESRGHSRAFVMRKECPVPEWLMSSGIEIMQEKEPKGRGLGQELSAALITPQDKYGGGEGFIRILNVAISGAQVVLQATEILDLAGRLGCLAI
jgi:hypothetical protein